MSQHIHRENAERTFLASFLVGLTGTPGKHVRYEGPRNFGHTHCIAVAVKEAEKQERFNERFMRNLIIRLDIQRGHSDGSARMTLNLSAHLTRQRSITCVAIATNFRNALTSLQIQLPLMQRRKPKSGVVSAKG